MMALFSHLMILPVLLPLVIAAVVVMLGDKARPGACRSLSVASCIALAVCSLYLLGWSATGEPAVYSMGDWLAPFGIVLVLDRLSALMLVLTSALALATVWFAARGWDSRGRHFHALLQLQLMGLNGAFLTGDLFNLFVFFEVLLIASYGLMLHAGGVARQRATLHYMIYNLVGSILFLFAVSLLYGVTGTLNMADLALQVAAAPAEDAMLIHSAGLMLLVVFAVKAAVLPLGFWLQDGYAAASPPVACLFSMMTKVGIYCILRVTTLIFGEGGGVGANLGADWVLPLGLLTLIVASIGALASRNLTTLVTYLVVASVGSTLIGIGVYSFEGISAALFYLVHSTFAIALLFLLAGEIAHERGALGTDLLPGPRLDNRAHLAPVFMFAAIAVAGLPPVSGFIAKVGILQSALDSPWLISAWAVILVSGLAVLIALGRSGSMLFWRCAEVSGPRMAGDGPVPLSSRGPALALALVLLALTAGARPVQSFMDATSGQLLDPQNYIEAVMRPDAGPATGELNVEGDAMHAHDGSGPAAIPTAARVSRAVGGTGWGRAVLAMPAPDVNPEPLR